jgi:hypothetical protein
MNLSQKQGIIQCLLNEVQLQNIRFLARSVYIYYLYFSSFPEDLTEETSFVKKWEIDCLAEFNNIASNSKKSILLRNFEAKDSEILKDNKA